MKKLWMVFAVTVLLAALFVLPLQAQGGWTGFDTVRVLNFYRAETRDALVVVDNGTINATGVNQPITSTGNVGTSGASLVVEPEGTFLVLRNIGAGTITLTETGTLISAGNIVLGPNDAATLISDGTNWIQIGSSNN